MLGDQYERRPTHANPSWSTRNFHRTHARLLPPRRQRESHPPFMPVECGLKTRKHGLQAPNEARGEVLAVLCEQGPRRIAEGRLDAELRVEMCQRVEQRACFCGHVSKCATLACFREWASDGAVTRTCARTLERQSGAGLSFPFNQISPRPGSIQWLDRQSQSSLHAAAAKAAAAAKGCTCVDLTAPSALGSIGLGAENAAIGNFTSSVQMSPMRTRWPRQDRWLSYPVR